MTYISLRFLRLGEAGEARGGWSGGGEKQVNVQVQVKLSHRFESSTVT